jgi:hypothetical protein
MSKLTPEQIKFNQSLWHWYPLGQLDAIWHLLENLNHHTDTKYHKEIDTVLCALEKLDQKVRQDRYPFKKKQNKQKRKS